MTTRDDVRRWAALAEDAESSIGSFRVLSQGAPAFVQSMAMLLAGAASIAQCLDDGDYGEAHNLAVEWLAEWRGES